MATDNAIWVIVLHILLNLTNLSTSFLFSPIYKPTDLLGPLGLNLSTSTKAQLSTTIWVLPIAAIVCPNYVTMKAKYTLRGMKEGDQEKEEAKLGVSQSWLSLKVQSHILCHFGTCSRYSTHCSVHTGAHHLTASTAG